MLKSFSQILLLLVVSSYFLAINVLGQDKNQASWLEVKIGIISPASEDILQSAMDAVQSEGHAGLLVTLDTPGGSLESTRAMVKNILGAPYPIVVWVGPDGSRAGSAGAFITLAGHIAAMAPGTNIGAAHPIKADGSDIEQSEGARKVENDTAAFMESIAKVRERNIEMAKSFVLTSASITADEALNSKVIDLIAKNQNDLMGKIDGRTIEIKPGESITLATANVELIVYQESAKQKFLSILANPNLFYLLFVAGMIGLGFELTHPGVIFPGVFGGICMILALMSTSVLPVSFAAMVLVAAGVAFMIGEIFLPSFGVLGIGGFVAFVIGSFLLVDPGNKEGLRVSIFTIVPGAATIAAAMFLMGYLILRAKRSKVRAGVEAMIGEEAVALVDFKNGEGKVRLQGEIWNAQSEGNLDLRKDQKVIINAVDGLKVRVKGT